MNYPRIYSLSTVGILKHYMHDYLFHALRTDFVGGNGVGKSIIADLLQLLFVYDTDLIKFGTDGVSHEPRSIYKLPYKSSIAYCFLNIEVKDGKYITIGIAIYAQTGARITPFLITKDTDISKPMDELVLPKEELLLDHDFLTAQRAIPDLKALALQLFENKRLYLNMFKTKEEVNKYYQFLYDKNILSINLSAGENLKAFAKVIQSFSKAKALDLKPANASKSLKEFLFEDSDTELMEDYTSQQYALEKLLREYNSLDKYIKILEQKQQGLLRLKDLNRLMREKDKMLKTTLLCEKYASLQKLKKEEGAYKNSLEGEKRNQDILELKNEKLPRIRNLLQNATKKAENNYDRHIEYQRIKDDSERLEADITELKVLNCPMPGEDWKVAIGSIDIKSRSAQSIKDLIKMAVPFLKEFKSPASIEEARSTQEREIHRFRQELTEALANTKELIAAFEGSSTESIIQWVVQQQQPLSKEQGAILLHYAGLPIKRPSAPDKGSRFVEPNQLLNQPEITAVPGKPGFWLRLGAIQEFIETEHDVSLFQDPTQFDRSLTFLLSKLRAHIRKMELTLSELDKISKAKDYDRQLIDIAVNLWLINYQNIEDLKVAVGCILQIGEKIEQLEQDRKGKETALEAILLEMPVKSTIKDPELLRQELRAIRDRQNSRSLKLAKYSTKLENNLEAVSKRIRDCERNLQETTRSLLVEEAAFSAQNSSFFTVFSENLSLEDLQVPRPSVEICKLEYEKAQNDYLQKYMEMVNRFEETQNEKNTTVNMELRAQSYHFRPLEQALLGNKITHTDDIAEALTTANAGRLSMADDIKNSMVKIFDKTLKRYKKYKELVQRINAFFIGRKISGRFYFKVDFAENKTIRIDFVEEIGARLRSAAKQGELPFDKPVADFIEEFFRRAGQLKEKVPVDKLLNPKTYFDLSVSLTDKDGQEIPGSTGESYSAIALLGIARLSLVQTETRKGIRFIILEEIGSLDNANFNTFPAIAREYGYQIITMAPQPFRTNLADEWYAHHLIKGKVDPNINFYPSASYFKTKDRSQDLSTYLKISEYELDRTESPS